MKASKTAHHATVIIGPGRVGRSLAAALGKSRADRSGSATGPDRVELRGRDDGLDELGGKVVLLAVPDGEITPLADRIGALENSPRLIGHTSGATGLAALSGAGAEGEFSVHPLQTVPDGETDLCGSPAAIAGSSAEALEAATELARDIGMRTFEIKEGDRAIYHAAASIASNFLITIEQTAAELLGGIEVDDPRQILEPLVRRSLDNWVSRGPRALTGPIVRGDVATVEAHRDALARQRPDLVGFYEVLAERTREIVTEGSRP